MEDASWLQEFPPQTVADLAVHSAKIKAVRAWILEAVAAHTSGATIKPYVLVLCGRSGCCKSTMVETICKEIDVSITTWSDDLIEVESWGDRWKPGRLDEANTRRTLLVDMADYAVQSNFPALELNTSKHCSIVDKTLRGIVKQESLKNSEDAGISCTPSPKRIILMHSPPFQHAKKGDQELYGDLMQAFNAPVIIVLSQVGGSDDMGFAVEKALGLGDAQKNRFVLLWHCIYLFGCTVRC